MAKRATVVTGTAGDVGWLAASRAVQGELSTHVRDLYGYVERSAGVLRRRELPSPQCVVIIEIGPPIRVYDAGQDVCWSRYPGGFVAGIDDQYSITQYRGEQSGIQLNLTPIGARVLLDLPMHVIAKQVVPLREVVPEAIDLAARLRDDPTWDDRFDRVERLLERRLRIVDPRTRAIAWAYDEIVRSCGRASIRGLRRDLGYSHRHMIAMFRDNVGLPPKALARLVRFDALSAQLRRGSDVGWAELAADLGFSDQAHLVRETRRFSGLTPSALRSLLSAPLVEDPTG